MKRWPEWREFTARRPYLAPRARRGAMERGNLIEKIANTGHIGFRRRQRPANNDAVTLGHTSVLAKGWTDVSSHSFTGAFNATKAG